MSVKKLYHATVPKYVRYPIGRWRRNLADNWLRLRAAEPLPPRRLLQNVQMTPYVREYLDVGQKAAAAITEHFAAAGLEADSKAQILDFGCGLSRTLRFLQDSEWRLAGCDIDEQTVGWSKRALPDIEFAINSADPPLPWPDQTFDGLFAVSVFTHFPAPAQGIWAAELARVLRPGGVALITTMGPHAFGSFANLDTAANRQRLETDGFLFHQRGDSFNASGAFHTEQGVSSAFADHFKLRCWQQGGLDGFQDLSTLIRLL